jgi:histidinol phosphatase-like PHP family hydrolase
MAMTSPTSPPARSLRPGNGALAEALFSLAEQEPPGDRRLALLKAGYAAFDAAGGGRRAALGVSPPWLRAVVEQLAACSGEAALEAAVQRLGGDSPPRRRSTRERYLSRAEAAEVLDSAPAELLPDRMRGAFHWHTTDSDGRAALETMARGCQRRGFAWSMVTDHSRGLEVASGLDAEGLRLQRGRIDRWNQAHGDEHTVFQGLEVEVLEDGTLDVPRGERLEVECVVAAVHRLFDPDRDQTERLLRTIAAPGVHVLAHPRARHFHHRPGLRARWETVFAACDFLLASDAHAPRHLEFDVYAAAIAVKAGISRERILNVMHADEVAVWLGER